MPEPSYAPRADPRELTRWTGLLGTAAVAFPAFGVVSALTNPGGDAGWAGRLALSVVCVGLVALAPPRRGSRGG
ncbi:MAG: hypothetical protein H6734_27335, partial [Alphaproteobacteria bacterium]|nr:hypothetical protein [Alphaproteobacteria bacterium]